MLLCVVVRDFELGQQIMCNPMFKHLKNAREKSRVLSFSKKIKTQLVLTNPNTGVYDWNYIMGCNTLSELLQGRLEVVHQLLCKPSV